MGGGMGWDTVVRAKQVMAFSPAAEWRYVGFTCCSSLWNHSLRTGWRNTIVGLEGTMGGTMVAKTIPIGYK